MWMQLIKSLLAVALIIAPRVAAAQSAPVPSEPDAFHGRHGLTLGVSAGLGYMRDNGSTIVCSGCDGGAITGMLEAHIGAMLGSRFALLLEIQGNAQQIAVDATSGQSATLRQVLVLGAVQLWVTPRFWLKLGLGAANLDVLDNSTGVAYAVGNTGFGVLAGAGLELISGRGFALDLQARATEGVYQYTAGTDYVTSGTIGLGLNWY
jgi:hypothetical protein